MPGKSLRRVPAAALAAVLAAGALAGCDAAPKAGTAALVDGDRITVRTLGDTVETWWGQLRRDPAAGQIWARSGNGAAQAGEPGTAPAEPGEADMRGALNLLVSFRIADEAAERAGVTVSGGRTAEIVDLLGRGGASAETITLANGLPRERTRDFARFMAVQDALMRHFGADGVPQSPANMQATQRFQALLVETAGAMDVEINPRYGSFDPQRVAIGPLSEELSTPATESARA
ncbi:MULTISPECIES: hypothetical protein [Actinomadura]|uniref:hypothetical protein n=1 Tax=Actinomadura TaxID=1988 RepID=UPI0003FAB4A3|nr:MULTISPECIES: hypothetical protein [Actinomadura]RSN70670.1 hypothetical protein DMH08_04980 [Actinomadura sp. WAC 06369]